jgi:ribosomal protein L11 methylase PrmA
MKWLEVQLEVAPDGTDVVAAAAGEIATGVEIRDAETVIRAAPGRALVIAHVAPDEQRLLFDAVEAAIARARDAGVSVDPVVVRTREADEDEWRDVWKQFFKARPSWCARAGIRGRRLPAIGSSTSIPDGRSGPAGTPRPGW